MSDNSTSKPQCVIDRKLVDGDTLTDLTDIGLTFFAPLCGKNRGAFVLNPSDRETWGCTRLPQNFPELAGVEKNITLKDVNAIKEQFVGGNLTASETVDLLDLFTKSVYFSTPDVDKDPFACEVSGIGVLECDAPTVEDLKIRSVTLTGLFVPALWATNGKELTLKDAKHFYSSEDFMEMKDLGLNTVQIPIPVRAFEEDSDGRFEETLNYVLRQADDAGLQAIIALVGDNDVIATVGAANILKENPVVLGMTLPTKDMALLKSTRTAAPGFKLFVPVNGGDLKDLDFEGDKNVYASLELGHISTIADIASSSSMDDRSKLFYHEAVSCMQRSPIEFTKCYRGIPVFVSGGFDLAVDNCIFKDFEPDKFIDYGQCDRFNETITSGWWEAHRKSYAERQLFAFDQGVGWSFSAWKIEGDDNSGILDTPAKLFSLKDVTAAGLMPDQFETTGVTCRNPPVNDFAMGDATFPPTPAPPPDCGNGWWRADLGECEYWIPPAPTPAPTTAAPTLSPTPCPTCPTCPEQHNTIMLTVAVIGGAIVGFVLNKVTGRNSQGYTSVP